MTLLCIGILAVLQGGVIGYLLRQRVVKPKDMSALINGEVTNITMTMDQDGRHGTIEFRDYSVNMPSFHSRVRNTPTPAPDPVPPSFAAPPMYRPDLLRPPQARRRGPVRGDF